MADENLQAAPPPETVPALPDGVAADPPTQPAPQLAPEPRKEVAPEVKKEVAPESKDVFREIAETVVFVVVLVLLLRTFIAEAFVIPTGSMATTLWGYQKVVICPRCGFKFPVNCSSQVDPANAQRIDVMSCTCPNCMYNINFERNDIPDWNSGDRVLVFKAWYDSGLPGGRPKRQDVVVFKFPAEPQKDGQAMNYIKRLIGLPEETIAIRGGQLYLLPGPRANPPPPPRDAITNEAIFYDQPSYPWPDDPEAMQLFKAGKFTIIRKAPDKMLALRRIVYDNDYQATDLASPDQARWQPQGNWKPDSPALARSFSLSPGEQSWLRYRHLLRGQHGVPQLIEDMMGYNTGNNHRSGQYWVGDLMLECDAQVDQPAGQLWLELSRASDRFQARFDLASGKCKLVRLLLGGEEVALGEAATRLSSPGKYRLRFANFDERLTLWVDNELPFGDGVEYPAGASAGPVDQNDLEPASIGGEGASVTVSGLRLWRDTYYTTAGGADVRTFYIYKDHYLCLGDNSPESSDGRMWGMVPNRLMLGRALLVYFPFQVPGWLPVNRVGIIH